MKILIVSNLFPPHYSGGYELRCGQVAKYLSESGHTVRVITSSYCLPAEGAGRRHGDDGDSSYDFPIDRILRHCGIEPPSGGRREKLAMIKRQLQDIRQFIKIIDQFEPDIVNWWNLAGLTKAILPIPALRQIPDVHCVDDGWMIREFGKHGERDSLLWFGFWEGSLGPAVIRPVFRFFVRRWAGKLQREGIPVQPFSPQPRHVCFISEFRKLEHFQAGLDFLSSEVIYGGVKPEQFFLSREESSYGTTPLRLLYAGFVGPPRGLHTIIEALGLLPQEIKEKVTLSVADPGFSQARQYIEGIKANIIRFGLSERVKFLGKIKHEDMPSVYGNHHVFIFSSTLAEGLPMTMMEAMVSGCAVITTGSGGAAEIADLAELPVFPKDHPLALSKLICKLVKDREFVVRIAKQGQQVGLETFTFSRMVEQIEAMFRKLCGTKSRSHSGMPARACTRLVK